MKNISRRVFIKGMAVAAVATAASTVLTGCKLPVTPEEPEVVPTPANTYTFKDGDNTLTISAPKYTTANFGDANKENIFFSIDADNNLGETVQFVGSYSNNGNSDKEYMVVISAKAYDDKGHDVAAVSFETDALGNYTNLLTSGKDTLGKNSVTNNAGVFVKDYAGKWATIVMTVEVYKPVADGQTGTNTKYYYKANGNADGKAEFTFTK